MDSCVPISLLIGLALCRTWSRPWSMLRPLGTNGCKHDGYRTELVIEDGHARAFTRRGIDWTSKYSPIVECAEALSCQCAIIDGEMIV